MSKKMMVEITERTSDDQEIRTGAGLKDLANPCDLERLDDLTVTVGPARTAPLRSTRVSVIVSRFMFFVDDIIVSASDGFDGVALAIRDRVSQFRQEFRTTTSIENFA